jgi:ketosteroid isomerase-like protein
MPTVQKEIETAIEVGQFTLSAADDQTVDHGTFVVIWKNVNGAWKLHRDIWNSNIADNE